MSFLSFFCRFILDYWLGFCEWMLFVCALFILYCKLSRHFFFSHSLYFQFIFVFIFISKYWNETNECTAMSSNPFILKKRPFLLSPACQLKSGEYANIFLLILFFCEDFFSSTRWLCHLWSARKNTLLFALFFFCAKFLLATKSGWLSHTYIKKSHVSVCAFVVFARHFDWQRQIYCYSFDAIAYADEGV